MENPRKRSPWLKEIPSAERIFKEAIYKLKVDKLIEENIPFSQIAEKLEAECHNIYLQYEKKVREEWIPRIETGEINVDRRIFETSLANSARARAGSTAEKIIGYLLKQSGIPFQARKFVYGEQPDIIIPDVGTLIREPSKATILSIKREVRERWRVSVGEAYILREVHNIDCNYWFVSLGHDIDEYICSTMAKLRIRVYILNHIYEKFKHIEGTRQLSKLFDDLSQFRK